MQLIIIHFTPPPTSLSFLIRSNDSYQYCLKESESLRSTFGSYLLDIFIKTSKEETAAVKECILQLWKLHSDFCYHSLGPVNNTAGKNNNNNQSSEYTPYIIHEHHKMFAGITDTLIPDSKTGCRLTIWKGLPRKTLEKDDLLLEMERI